MAAVDALAEIPGLKVVTASPWYRSGAISKFAQPDFCNGIVKMEGEIGPHQLLAAVQQIENNFGRQRGITDAARTLDLDIIDLNGTIRAISPVILPHPRAHLRAFVLRPLMDVAPGWRHPYVAAGRCVIAGRPGAAGHRALEHLIWIGFGSSEPRVAAAEASNPGGVSLWLSPGIGRARQNCMGPGCLIGNPVRLALHPAVAYLMR